MIEVFKSQVKISNEMEVRLANLDWSSTALGIYSEWPANLKATINIILRSPVPMLLLVGEEGITIFNNSFSLKLENKFPDLLGKKIIELPLELSELFQLIVKETIQGNNITLTKQYESIGESKTVWLKLDCSPVLNDNSPILGALLIVSEVTEQNLSLVTQKDKVGIKGNEDAREFSLNIEDGLISIFNQPYVSIVQTDLPVKSEILSKEPHTAALPGVAGVSPDNNKRKEAENALIKSEERLRCIIEATNDGIWDYNIKTKSAFWNERLFEIIGYNPDEITNPGFYFLETIIHPDDISNVKSAFENSYKNGSPYQVEYRLRHKKGHFVYVHSKGKPIYENNKIVRVAGIITDVSERKQAEKSYLQSEAKLSAVLNQLVEGVIITDTSGAIVFINESAEKLHGIRKLNVTPENYSETYHLLTEDKQPFPNDQLPLARAVFNGETVLNARWYIHRPDGTEILAVGSARPVFGVEGAKIGAVLTLRDETERVASEYALKESNIRLTRINNDLDNFIYTASHDLKAPISNIEGLINGLNQILEESHLKNDDIPIFIGLIRESIHKFKNTIKDLTEIAKAQNGGEEDQSEISFKELLDEVKVNIKNFIVESQAIIEEDFSLAPKISFSRKNLRSILYNLVSNAIKYSSPERLAHVKIYTRSFDNDEVVLYVQDNGLGIKEENKYKIFQMFKRLHQHVEGSGIGLSIVKKIIDNNGGKIEIESEEGNGTLFRIFFKNDK